MRKQYALRSSPVTVLLKERTLSRKAAATHSTSQRRRKEPALRVARSKEQLQSWALLA